VIVDESTIEVCTQGAFSAVSAAPAESGGNVQDCVSTTGAGTDVQVGADSAIEVPN
jgi:hypothetical protein